MQSAVRRALRRTEREQWDFFFGTIKRMRTFASQYYAREELLCCRRLSFACMRRHTHSLPAAAPAAAHTHTYIYKQLSRSERASAQPAAAAAAAAYTHPPHPNIIPL